MFCDIRVAVLDYGYCRLRALKFYTADSDTKDSNSKDSDSDRVDSTTAVDYTDYHAMNDYGLGYSR